MNRIIVALLLFMALGAVNADRALAAKDKNLIYHSFADEDSTEVVAVTEVQIKGLENGQTLIVRSKQSDQCLNTDEIVFDKSGDLISWHRTCPEKGSDFTVQKKGNSAKITGQFMGSPINKEIGLDNESLHVYPKYSLSPFAFSDEQKIKFAALRRDQLSKLPMQAIQKGEGTIELNGKNVDAVKVYYSIIGKLRERYYNHNYYYRKSDGLFIKKREQDGFTEVLVEEK